MFRKLIQWLSKRFPEQLTVTRLDWTQLREEVASYNVMYQNQAQMVEKIVSLEKRVQQIENANGFIKTGTGSFKLER